MITSLADAQQCCLASSRMFSGNQSKPGGQIFGSPELAPIARAGNERGRHQRANSWNGHQSASAIVATRQSFNLPRDLGNALFEFNQIIEQSGERPAHHGRQVVLFIGEHSGKVGSELADP